MLKNRSRTLMVVPRGWAASLTSRMRPPSMATRVAAFAPSVHVVSSTRATDAIEASASPRKPSVPIAARSSVFANLRGRVSFESEHRVVAHHAFAVVGDFKQTPATSLYLDRDARRPASIEFSTSSLATDAGRSTTSPAAI
jgi:hypothetical protein